MPATAQAHYKIHWNCLRCWRTWTTDMGIQGTMDRADEYMTLEHLCEECAGKNSTEINRLRAKHKRERNKK